MVNASEPKGFCLMAPLPEGAVAAYEALKATMAKALPNMVPAKGKPHLTLMWLGNVDPDYVQEAVAIATRVLSKARPVPLQAMVVDMFPGGPYGTPIIVKYARTPALMALQQELATALGPFLDPTATRYPEYVPHTTIGYSKTAPAGLPGNTTSRKPLLSWTMDKVILTQGEEIKAWNLGKPLVKDKKPTKPPKAKAITGAAPKNPIIRVIDTDRKVEFRLEDAEHTPGGPPVMHGWITIHKKGHGPSAYWWVGSSNIESGKGQGYGTDLYLAAIKYASEDAMGLVSTDEASSEARAVRPRLKRRGIRIQLNAAEDSEGYDHVLMTGRVAPSIPVEDSSGQRTGAHTVTAARKLFWHGTSSLNLRGILKHGLLPSGTKAVYDSEDDNNASRSMKTYGGVYMTDNWMTAYTAAGTAMRKRGGNRLMVGITYEDRTDTAMADEDDIIPIIETAVGRSVGELSRGWGRDLGRFRKHTVAKGPEYRPELWGDLIQYVHTGGIGDTVTNILQRIERRWNMPRLTRRLAERYGQVWAAVENLVRAYTLNIIWIDARNTLNIVKEDLKSEADPEKRRAKKPLWDAINDPPKALAESYANLVAATTAFSRALPETRQEERPTLPGMSGLNSIRSMAPITFRGKNRIVTVVEVEDLGPPTYGDDITFHYGGAAMERPFMAKYAVHVGPNNKGQVVVKASKDSTPKQLGARVTGAWGGQNHSYAWIDPNGELWEKWQTRAASLTRIAVDIHDTHSYAWISPDGGFHELHREPHSTWLAKHHGDLNEETAVEAGWVKVTNPFMIMTDSQAIRPQPTQTVIDMLIDAVVDWGLDPEEETFAHYWYGGSKMSSMAEWVHRHGHKEGEDRLFKAALRREGGAHLPHIRIRVKHDGPRKVIFYLEDNEYSVYKHQRFDWQKHGINSPDTLTGVGYISMTGRADGSWSISSSDIHKTYRNSRYGVDLYLAAIKYATEDGGGLFSGHSASDLAKAVRSRLAKLGIAITPYVADGYPKGGVVMTGKVAPSIPVVEESGQVTGSWVDDGERITRARVMQGEEFDADRLPNVLDQYPRIKAANPSVHGPNVTVYRAVNPEVRTTIEPGDWAALRKSVCQSMGRGTVISRRVPIGDIVWAGTDEQEWLYVPKSGTVTGATGGPSFIRIQETHDGDNVSAKFTLVDEANKALGSLGITKVGDAPNEYWWAFQTHIPNHQDLGYGTDLFLAAIKYATEDNGHGIVIRSLSTSDKAKAVVPRLKRKGVHVQLGVAGQTEFVPGSGKDILMSGKIAPSIPVEDSSGQRTGGAFSEYAANKANLEYKMVKDATNAEGLTVKEYAERMANRIRDAVRKHHEAQLEAAARPEGEEEEGTKPKGAQRNSDPLPPEFRQEMAAKGAGFKNPDSGNKVLFDSLPWKEQLKYYKQWKERQPHSSAHPIPGDMGVDHLEEGQPAPPEDHVGNPDAEYISPSVAPQVQPAQELSDGTPAATGTNLHPDSMRSFTDLGTQLNLSDEEKEAIQQEVFQKPATEIDSHASAFRDNQTKHGFVVAALIFLADLGLHAHAAIVNRGKKLVTALYKELKDSHMGMSHEERATKTKVLEHWRKLYEVDHTPELQQRGHHGLKNLHKDLSPPPATAKVRSAAPVAITVSKDLLNEWWVLEVDTASHKDGQERGAFVAAVRGAQKAGGKYTITMDQAAVAYMHDLNGPLGHDDIWEDAVNTAKAIRDPEERAEELPKAKGVLSEAKKLRAKFPLRRKATANNRRQVVQALAAMGKRWP